MCSSNGSSMVRNAKAAKHAKTNQPLRSWRSWRSFLLSHEREQYDVPNRRTVRQQHHQPIDADTLATRGRQPVLERANVVLVHGVRLEVALGTAGQLPLEPPP